LPGCLFFEGVLRPARRGFQHAVSEPIRPRFSHYEASRVRDQPFLRE